ncbi:hypothetical protein IJ541_10570 [bacterium]|nr:hypothetical protein [bacterium]
MGLAASQARFLCITARKANCEYRSTELAQRKLEITNQLSDISNEYASAMNATKLIWSNDATSRDYGLSYALLMTPSAMNDFNPYLITSRSGAVVLNNQFAIAAKAAGIPKSGGIGSQTSRDKFIAALCGEGIVTVNTTNAITTTMDVVGDSKGLYAGIKTNSAGVAIDNTTGVNWNPAAGMGAEPINKSGAETITLSELVMSEAIGQQKVDWSQLLITDTEKQITKAEKDAELARLQGLKDDAKLGILNTDIINQLSRDLNNEKNKSTPNQSEVTRLETLLGNATQVMNQFIKQNDLGIEYVVDSDGNITSIKKDDVIAAVQAQLENDYNNYNSSLTYIDANGQTKEFEELDYSKQNIFNTTSNSLTNNQYTLVKNGIINHYESEIADLTLGDILSGDVVLMNVGKSTEDFAKQVKSLFASLTKVLGYSPYTDMSGQGLNVDDASSKALEFAYEMVVGTFLRAKNAINNGSRTSSTAMTENSVYLNAQNYNRIGTGNTKISKTDYSTNGVSLSNMMSAFLTYYDNLLYGMSSSYVVGKAVDTSVYVTDNVGYQYIAQTDPNAITAADRKSADFFDQLYNNILEHGWREDAALDDNEYLESALKDGRYSMSSLNADGYYYQTRYNETGYMEEVSDTDAIARAEAEFASKKAELTYKEDKIDFETKQLDAEISALSTEYDTVKGLISKSIEKTFTMFSN